MVADRIRVALERHPIADPNRQNVTVTPSFGVAQPEPGEAVDQLVDRADRAMYAAKSAGRNRVLSTTQLVPVLQSVTPQSITLGAPLALANAAFTPKKAAEC